jgi:hypothetical protein
MAGSKNSKSTGTRKTTARSNRRGLAKSSTTLKKTITPVKKTVAEEAEEAKAKAPRAQRNTAPKVSEIRSLPPEERYRMICEAAYFLAEKRGFQGDTVNDWLEAERQIENLYPSKPRSKPRLKK